MVEVANTQNRIPQPMAIPMICILRRFRSVLVCSFVYKRCPSTYHISNSDLTGKYCACTHNLQNRYYQHLHSYSHLHVPVTDLQWEVGVFLLLFNLQAGQVGEPLLQLVLLFEVLHNTTIMCIGNLSRRGSGRRDTN